MKLTRAYESVLWAMLLVGRTCIASSANSAFNAEGHEKVEDSAVETSLH